MYSVVINSCWRRHSAAEYSINYYTLNIGGMEIRDWDVLKMYRIQNVLERKINNKILRQIYF